MISVRATSQGFSPSSSGRSPSDQSFTRLGLFSVLEAWDTDLDTGATFLWHYGRRLFLESSFSEVRFLSLGF